MKSRISLLVPEKFVVARLGIENIDSNSINNWDNFLSLNVPAETGSVNNGRMCTVRCKLLKIFFNDIFGFNFNFYDEATNEEENDENFNMEGDQSPSDNCHPNLVGCLKWYFTNALSLDGKNKNLNDDGIWKLFTENVWPKDGSEGSLYYRTYHVKPAPKGVWQKAGMGVLGVGTAGGIGYALFDNLIRRPKEKEVLDRKLAEDKAKNLVRKTEVKKVLKKAKGNGASRRRQGKLRK